MISGLDLKAVVPYTLKDDKENPTVWKLGVVPSNVFARATDESSGTSIERAYGFLRLCLRGWDNFDVPFQTERCTIFGEEMDVVPMNVLGKLPFKVIGELSAKIIEINQLTDTERKN